MANTIMIGAQWGDEGKGRITDLVAKDADLIARFSGGNNAGHTVIVGQERFELHLLPCGILHPQKKNVLGNGMVLHLPSLVSEMDALSARGIDLSRLYISDAAQVVMPYHLLLDQLEEEGKGDENIGTTRRGIGPAYVDKVGRRGIRICDLLHETQLRERLTHNLSYTNRILQHLYQRPPFDPQTIIDELRPLIERIRPHITNTTQLIAESLKAGETLFFEGAQGTLLDVDHGTYPFVTSSNPIAGGVCTGCGIGPTHIQRVLGVTKAYLTRVGTGPFPTELFDENGEKLQKLGHEFGVTTGRPRRCGWFDAALLRHAVRVNGLTEIALTKLDVLSHFDTLPVCNAYEYQGKRLNEYPSNTQIVAQLKPIYTKLPGWKQDISHIRNYADLPKEARHYIEWIEAHAQVRASILSLGPERDMAIIRETHATWPSFANHSQHSHHSRNTRDLAIIRNTLVPFIHIPDVIQSHQITSRLQR